MIKRLILALVLLALLTVGYFMVVLNWSYSSGDRAGWVQKFSRKGWVCKTWEGELALVSLPGSTVEKFLFTVHDDAVAIDIQHHMGKRVTLHYDQKVGLPTSCFGETRYFITQVTPSSDIPLGPGVVLPGGNAAQPPPGPASPASR